MTVSESLLLYATDMAVWQWHEVLYDKSPACCTLTLGGAVTEMFFSTILPLFLIGFTLHQEN